MQEDLEEFRSASPGQNPEHLEELRTRLKADRETLERRQRAMETRLSDLFTAWDNLQSRNQPGDHAGGEKQAVLKDMREILSNRTYLRNIVNDLVDTIG